MMLPSAFQIGTVLLIAVMNGLIVPSTSSDNFDEKLFATKAVNFCVTKTFLKYFDKFTLPLDSDVADGSRIYSGIKGDFEETGKSGMIVNLPLENVKKVVDEWQSNSLISSEEATNLENVLAKESFKTVLEHVVVKDNGDVIYGTSAFIELANTDSGMRTGTIFYSFIKFKIPTPATINHERASIDSGRCKLWGQFCPTTFNVDGFTAADSKKLFSYMRSEAVKQFFEESGSYITYIEREAARYERFLPVTYKESLKTMENSPDTLPTKLFTKDPFTTKFSYF